MIWKRKVLKNFRLNLPREIRTLLNVKEGDAVDFIADEGRFILKEIEKI